MAVKRNVRNSTTVVSIVGILPTRATTSVARILAVFYSRHQTTQMQRQLHEVGVVENRVSVVGDEWNKEDPIHIILHAPRGFIDFKMTMIKVFTCAEMVTVNIYTKHNC